jgi:hypothetical protein
MLSLVRVYCLPVGIPADASAKFIPAEKITVFCLFNLLVIFFSFHGRYGHPIGCLV